MQEHRITVSRAARYFTLGRLEREVWFVLHGYGQLAGRFLRHFDPIDDGSRLVVAPEGLSRFYVSENSAERVGATWMTKEDRLAEIDDYVRYLDAVYAAVTPMLAASGPGAALWLMSTPNGKRGFFWDEWSDESRNWTRISVKATDCPRISTGFLEEERKRMGETMFRQEYLCDFMDAQDAVFREADVLASLARGVEPLYGGRPV